MKTIINSLLSITLLCSSAMAAEEVNVYSYRHYEADQELYDQFTESTGIKVNTINAKEDALITRIKEEGDKSEADLFIAADVGRLVKAQQEGITQAVESTTLTEQVPAHLRDAENHWFAFTVRARIIAYAKDRVNAGEIKTYQDLAKPAWKGRVLSRSSSNIYNQSLLASMIANNGEKKTLIWALNFRKNMAREPEGSDRDQMRAVAAGIADACIVNTYYYGFLVNSSDPKDREVAEKLVILFPNQETTGAHINISGGAVCKYAPNKANAVKLLEFLTAKKAQNTFPNTTYEYPLSMETSSEVLKNLGEFKADPMKLDSLAEHRKAAAKIFLQAGWK